MGEKYIFSHALKVKTTNPFPEGQKPVPLLWLYKFTTAQTEVQKVLHLQTVKRAESYSHNNLSVQYYNSWSYRNYKNIKRLSGGKWRELPLIPSTDISVE